MKQVYVQPKVEVYEISAMGQMMANSVPGGGEIDLGGRGPVDAPTRRNNGWDDYEND